MGDAVDQQWAEMTSNWETDSSADLDVETVDTSAIFPESVMVHRGYRVWLERAAGADFPTELLDTILKFANPKPQCVVSGAQNPW